MITMRRNLERDQEVWAIRDFIVMHVFINFLMQKVQPWRVYVRRRDAWLWVMCEMVISVKMILEGVAMKPMEESYTPSSGEVCIKRRWYLVGCSQWWRGEREGAGKGIELMYICTGSRGNSAVGMGETKVDKVMGKWANLHWSAYDSWTIAKGTSKGWYCHLFGMYWFGSGIPNWEFDCIRCDVKNACT